MTETTTSRSTGARAVALPGWEATAGLRAVVTHPGPRVSETVHALLDQGCVVSVACEAPDAAVADLLGRGLVTLVEPDSVLVLGADLVVRDLSARQGHDGTASDEGGTGEVILVGGGPGAPGLLTLDGAEALRTADVVVYDRLAPLAALDLAPPSAERVPVGKIPRGVFTPQESINGLLVRQAQEGKRVVRLKGGDSFVFGRGGEEWLACAAAGVPVRVVPGVTSAVAVPALAGVPVTHRGVTPGFIVVSGHVGPDDPRSTVDWQALASSGLTIVVLMGVATLESIAARLVECGLPAQTPAAVIADGAMPSQRSVRADLGTIATLAERAGVGAPAVAVIGETVGVLEQVSQPV